jgi:hypothetical protein
LLVPASFVRASMVFISSDIAVFSRRMAGAVSRPSSGGGQICRVSTETLGFSASCGVTAVPNKTLTRPAASARRSERDGAALGHLQDNQALRAAGRLWGPCGIAHAVFASHNRNLNCVVELTLIDGGVVAEVERDASAVAHVYGRPVHEVPTDLYIPPEALEIILESFEGPLDLLLYLIRRHNLDVLDIPMAELTRQYLVYVEGMRHSYLELAAEYLLMAAVLIEIKSRMLLPRPDAASDESEPEDPRAELVRRLLEYEQMKLAAERLDRLPQPGP